MKKKVVTQKTNKQTKKTKERHLRCKASPVDHPTRPACVTDSRWLDGMYSHCRGWGGGWDQTQVKMPLSAVCLPVQHRHQRLDITEQQHRDRWGNSLRWRDFHSAFTIITFIDSVGGQGSSRSQSSFHSSLHNDSDPVNCWWRVSRERSIIRD